MVVRVVTGLRAALEMSRVAGVRVIGKGSGRAPKRHRQDNISAVINNVIRFLIFSPPLVWMR